jgi:hypothetical protein
VLANYADLTLANLAVQSPASPQSGSQVTVGWDDVNIGNAAVNTAFSDYVLVQSVNPDNSLTTIATGSVAGNATLASGAASPQIFTFTLPDGAAGTGNFLVTVTTDSGQAVKEYDASGNPAYGNNTGTLNFTSTLAELPDLVVSNVTAPTSCYDNTPVTISWTVTNSGQLPATGVWFDQVYFDPLGEPQSAAPADSVQFSGTLNAGQSYTQTDTLSPPSIVGQYTVRVVTDADQSVQEQSYSNNTGTSAQPLNDQAVYIATVSTTVTTVSNGTPIPLSGIATLTSAGAPAANVPVAVDIMVSGATRTLIGTTDSTGNYSITFQPLQYEAGEYSVAAADPGVPNPPAQAYFEIVGIIATPATASVQVIPDTPLSGQFTLTNLSDVTLTGLTATSSGGPAGLTVQLTPPGELAGNGTATLGYSLDATSTQAAFGVVSINVTTDQGAVLDIPLNVSIAPLTPVLAVQPGSLDSGMVVGAQSLISFTVTNNGGAASGDLQVSLPATAYLSLASPATIPSLAPGASSTVTLELTPASNLPLEEYSGALVVSNGQTGISVPYIFTAITSAVGDVHVLVDDDLTNEESGAPHVQGATVNLLNPYDNSQVVATGATDATGAVTFTNIPAGPYDLQVQANGHSTYNGSITVVAGITNNIEPFVQSQLVTYTWVFQYTPIQDTYTINLQTTFATDVPAPVVTITAPATIPTLAPGQSAAFNVTLTNHGLVAAQGITLSASTDPEYTFTALAGQIGALAADSSMVVPLIVTRAASAGAALTPSRLILLGGTYSYVSGTQNVSNTFYTIISTPGPGYGAGGGGGGTYGTSNLNQIFGSFYQFAGANGIGGGSFNPFATNQLPPVLANASVSVPMTLQLSQGSTAAGSAVTGTLTLNNEETTGALENIDLNVIVTDANGNLANGVFYISNPTLGGALTAVDGTGVLPAMASGTAAYVFIPDVTAAPNGPTVYNIGGTLSYVDPATGGEVTVSLAPYPMTVNPVPLLNINYFLQQDVEQNVPAVLGMLVTNTGGAAADQLSLTTPQPTIVQTQTQTNTPLHIQITGSQVGAQTQTGSLTANFGDINPGQTGDAAFYLLSSLPGEFLNFTATFSHTAPGGTQTSAISSVLTHELIHAGDFLFPGNTGAIDYLVDDVPNPSSLPDTVYLSDGTTAPVNVATGASARGTISATQLSVQVTAQVTPGWDYIQLPDPGVGYTLSQVVRSDGTIIPVSDQAWTTDATFDSSGNATVNHELHILDFNSTGSYTVYYQSQAQASSISPTLQWDPAGGADVGYSIGGAPVPQDNTVDLFWASGPHFADAIGGPIFAAGVLVPAGTAPGSHAQSQITDGVLETPPAGATYLLAVADPNNLLGNFSDAQNVQALAVLPDVVVDSLSTTDSRSLTVDYHVDFENVTEPLTINFYRSPTPQFDPNHNILLATQIDYDPAIGTHEDKDIPISGGLAPNTLMPYVLAVANQDNAVAETTTGNDTAFFRTYVIGAVAVGFDPSSLFTSTPATWVQTMASSLITQDGYQAAIPFTWDSAYPDPQLIIDAGNTLAGEIMQAAESIPNLQPNDVIDLHLIGHSRGSVVVSEAIQDILADPPPLLNPTPAETSLTRGYYKITLLDPHPANLLNLPDANIAPLSLPISFSSIAYDEGILSLAAAYYYFEYKVQDPTVFIPSRVNEADILYEKTDAADISSLPESILNLQGLDPSKIIVQDPTQTQILADNLTGVLTVSPTGTQEVTGHSEVHDWYLANVVQPGLLATNTTPATFGPPSTPPITAGGLISGPQVSGLTSAGLQTLLNANASLAIQVTNNTDLQTVFAAIKALSGPATPEVITVFLGQSAYGDLTPQPPDGVSVLLIGNGSTTVTGQSPALTVSSGIVVVAGLTFTTSTDSPTILITGGNLILSDDIIEESTGGGDAAIAITGGTLDLGTPASPGNNIVNVNGPGAFLDNATQNLVPATGDTFTLNGMLQSASSLSFTGLSSSLVSSVYGEDVTFAATVTSDSTGSAAPTGSVDFFDTTTNTDLGSVQLSSGIGSLNTSALGAGSHVIEATYSGDNNYLPSIDSLTETITPPLSVTNQSGNSYNRGTKLFTATLTIQNISGVVLNGQLTVLLTGLPPGVILSNASGSSGGTPNITVPVNNLQVGGLLTITLQFSDPSNEAFSYLPELMFSPLNLD